MDNGTVVTYRLVGPDESDIKQGKISITSPVARALVGREVGDETVAFHAGLDEVFYIGEDQCPRCSGRDKAELFAGEVTKIRNHLALQDRELWIWGDRLIDGKITGMEQLRQDRVIQAEVPLTEMFGYATDLRSATQGRATYTMQFDHYDEVPRPKADEIVARARGVTA